MLERWFHLAERRTTWLTEVTAGLSTFLALSYIFVVNPAILGQTGIPRSAVLLATVVTSVLATLAMGLRTNLPFVLAPGMEINIYVVSFAAAAGLSWRSALGTVFWSGVLFLLFTVSGLRRRIIDSLPDEMSGNLAASVGVLLIAVALQVAGILRYERARLTGWGGLDERAAILAVTALIVFLFAALRVRAAVLFGIIAGSLVAALLGIRGDPMIARGGMFAGVGAVDLGVILRPHVWAIVLALFLIDFYGSVAKLLGLLRNTGLLRDGRLPRLGEALLIDGAAATTGSLLGTTSVLVYAESGVGIAAGGRTGLTAVTAALAMLACLAAAPLMTYVPIVATSGALLYVGWRLLPTREDLGTFDIWQWMALSGMAAVVVMDCRLDQALLLGLALYLMRNCSKGVRLNAYAVGSLGLLMLGWALSL